LLSTTAPNGAFHHTPVEAMSQSTVRDGEIRCVRAVGTPPRRMLDSRRRRRSASPHVVHVWIVMAVRVQTAVLPDVRLVILVASGARLNNLTLLSLLSRGDTHTRRLASRSTVPLHRDTPPRSPVIITAIVIDVHVTML